MIEPLSGEADSGLVGMSDRLRGWDWPIPDELLVFGTDGGGDPFGLWYPPAAESDDPAPVVRVGAIFEPICMALAGTELTRFLLGLTAYYLTLEDAPSEALDALALPEPLRVIDEDGDLAPYVRWADPELEDLRLIHMSALSMRMELPAW